MIQTMMSLSICCCAPYLNLYRTMCLPTEKTALVAQDPPLHQDLHHRLPVSRCRQRRHRNHQVRGNEKERERERGVQIVPRRLSKQMLKRMMKTKLNADIDSTQLCSTAALGWAKRVCSFAYQNDGECAYDHVDVFTEFSGSTCAESAVESVINHMNPKPTLNFCYSADIKSGCRKVAMSTRYDLGCLKHTNKNIVITMPTTWFLFFFGALMMQIVNALRSNIVLFW